MTRFEDLEDQWKFVVGWIDSIIMTRCVTRRNLFVVCTVFLILNTSLIHAARTTSTAVSVYTSLRRSDHNSQRTLSAKHAEHKTLMLSSNLHVSSHRFQQHQEPPDQTSARLILSLQEAVHGEAVRVFAVGLLTSFRQFFKKIITEKAREVESQFVHELGVLVEGSEMVASKFVHGMAEYGLLGAKFALDALIAVLQHFGRSNTVTQMMTVLKDVYGGTALFMEGLVTQFALHPSVKAALTADGPNKMTTENALLYSDRVSVNMFDALIGSKRFLLPTGYKAFDSTAGAKPETDIGHYAHGWYRMRLKFGNLEMCTSAPKKIKMALGSSGTPDKGRGDLCTIM